MSPLVVGLVGGVASGKSTVAGILAGEREVTRIDADSIARRVLGQAAVRKALRARFPGLMDRHGTLDRQALAARVFADRDERTALEDILHPPIRRAIERSILAAETPYVVLDAPLLQETGADRLCAAVIYVRCPARVRRRRARTVRGWTAAEHAAREASQWPLRRKRAGATDVVDNSDGPERTRREVRRMLRRLERRERRDR